MKIWYEKYGWKDDPFSIRPNTEIVGLEKEKKNLQELIRTGSLSLITAPTGAGKTSLLLWLEKELRNDRINCVRINCIEKYTRKDLEQALRSHRRLRDAILFRKCPPNSVLLLDEVQQLPRDTSEYIKVLWDEKRIHSVVLASIEENLDNFTGSFKDRVIGQIIRIPELNTATAVELIKKRAGVCNPFDADAMVAVAELSNNIPRRILENCRGVCREYVDKDVKELNRLHVFEVVHPLTSSSLEEGPQLIKRHRNPKVKKIKVGETTKPSETGFETKKITETKISETKRRSEIDLGAIKPSETKLSETTKPSETGFETRGIMGAERMKQLFPGLSHMQLELVRMLTMKDANADELAVILKTTSGSIRKQLNRLKKAGIVKPITKTYPIKYGLSDEQKRRMVRE